MKLVVMTKSTYFVEEDKILTALFEEGLDNLHISKNEKSALYLERLLSLIPKIYHKYITIHQHYYLKAENSWQVFISIRRMPYHLSVIKDKLEEHAGTLCG